MSGTATAAGMSTWMAGSVGIIAIAHLIHALMPRVKKPVVLKLRHLKSSGAKMLCGAATDNIFTTDFCKQFLFLTHIADYAVMKYVDKDCETLVEQEHLHAKMHREGQKEQTITDNCLRHKPIAALLDFLLLRCGSAIGITLTGAIEASFGIVVYVSMTLPFVKDYPDNLTLFHYFEEMEHGAVTVHILRQKSNPVMRALSLPAMIWLWTVYALCPPLWLILSTPSLLLSPGTYPQLVLYYLAWVPSTLVGWLSVFWHWVLPFEERAPAETGSYQRLSKLVETRGIEFDVKSEETIKVGVIF